MRHVTAIAPYPKLAEIFEQLREEVPLDYSVHTALCDEALPIVRKKIKQGCRIFISRGETATILRRELQAQDAYIVEIPITDYDRLSMLTKAIEYGNKIALIGFNVSKVFSTYLQHLVHQTVQLKFYKLSKASHIEATIKKIKNDGFSIIAGTPCAVDYSQKYDFIGIPLHSEISSVRVALSDAAKLVTFFDNIDNTNEHSNIYNTRSIVFDFHRNIISDTTGIAEHTRRSIANTVRMGESGRDIHGELTVDNEKIHYIVNHIGNRAKNVYAVCHVHRESITTSSRGVDTAIRSLDDFLAASPAMQEKLQYLRGLAATDATVIISGETGTGKTVLAEALHHTSPRRGRPFISFNCASLPENLIESELFGYARGAFTGANLKGRKGYFEMANGGTILLDEVNDLSLQAQAKILKFIEERRFFPLGAEQPVSVDTRIICATNKHLSSLVEQGTFRGDLYYRLAVFEANIPPLRERREDIPVLVSHFLAHFSAQHKHVVRLGPKHRDILKQYTYPGNVRELRNIIERIVLACKLGLTIESVLENLNHAFSEDKFYYERNEDKLSEAEIAHIKRVLEEAHYNKTKAAALLGVSRSTLWRKCKILESNTL